MLDEAGVQAARKVEMEFFTQMGFYEYATREEAARSGKGKVIKRRRIDVSKEDSQHLDYRSRYAGKEFSQALTQASMLPPLPWRH